MYALKVGRAFGAFTVMISLLLYSSCVSCDEQTNPIDFVEFECGNGESSTPEFCKAYMSAVEYFGVNARSQWLCLYPCAAMWANDNSIFEVLSDDFAFLEILKRVETRAK